MEIEVQFHSDGPPVPPSATVRCPPDVAEGGTGHPSMKLIIYIRSTPAPIKGQTDDRCPCPLSVAERKPGFFAKFKVFVQPLYKMINFDRGVPVIARSNNCRGLLIALGEAQTSDLWPCRLSQGASEQAIEI